jgi:hypothetical protein
MAASKSPRARLLHIRDEIDGVAAAVEGLSFEQYRASYIHRRAIERAAQIISEAAKALPRDYLTRMTRRRGPPSSRSEMSCGTSTSTLTIGNFGRSQLSICPRSNLSCGG